MITLLWQKCIYNNQLLAKLLVIVKVMRRVISQFLAHLVGPAGMKLPLHSGNSMSHLLKKIFRAIWIIENHYHSVLVSPIVIMMEHHCPMSCSHVVSRTLIKAPRGYQIQYLVLMQKPMETGI